jgi:hypothetical protein
VSTALSPVQLAVAFAIGGSVLAVAVPQMRRDLRASRLAEPVESLSRIANAAVGPALEPGPRFPPSAPLTPAAVPRGTRVVDPPGTWDHPTWKALAFAPDGPHAFAYELESSAGKGEARFRASAHGDLDGDGVVSTLSLDGVADAHGARVLPELFVDREVE